MNASAGSLSSKQRKYCSQGAKSCAAYTGAHLKRTPSMNPTLHQPLAVHLKPQADPEFDKSCHTPLFVLRMRYAENGDWQTFVNVHAPWELLERLADNDVEAIHLETLPVNSVESRALGNRATFLVLGFRTKDGVSHPTVPRVLKLAFRRRFFGGLLGSVVGVGLLATPASWLGALLLVWGTHSVRTALPIPRQPFRIFMTVTSPSVGHP